MKTLFLMVIGYLLGSISTGVLLVRKLRPGLDLTKVGSGNIGATNVGRVLGAKWGIVTMVGDCVKGYLPVLLAVEWSMPPVTVAITALSAFLGHIYPLYLRLKGGKGVATALGVWLAISPSTALIAFIIWSGAVIISRSTAVGALSSAIALPIIVVSTISIGRGVYFLLALIISCMVFYTHRSNIRIIIEGKTTH